MTNPPDETSPGRVAIVAGATRGIGQATARRLARRGYSVVVNYAHNQHLADATVEAILADRGAAVAVRADIADELDVERLFTETNEAFGGVDAVVDAVVGLVPTGPLTDVPLAEFEALCRINTTGTFLINREAARHVRNGGAIVNLSSALAGSPVPHYAAHSASLAPTDVLTRVLARELMGRGITVNAILLDFDRPCEADRIADTVAYLLSAEGRSVTGQLLPVDHPGRDLKVRRNGGGPQH